MSHALRHPDTGILRLPDVMSLTGHSRSTVWHRSKIGLLPRPVKLGAHTTGWPSAEIAAINTARIAGANDDDIRALVADLHAKRTDAVKGA